MVNYGSYQNRRLRTLVALFLTSMAIGPTVGGCTQKPSVVPETSPINAAKNRVMLHRWRHLAQKARAVLSLERVSPRDFRTLQSEVEQFVKSMAGESGVALPSHERRELNILVTRLKQPHNHVEAYEIEKPLAQRGSTSRFQWPLKEVRVLSNFGLRVDPFDKDRRTFHNGVDLKAVKGTPVRPCDAGRVIEAGWRDDGCGLGVTVQHRGGFVSDYCHLAEVHVQVGQYVQRDVVLGEVGNTGRSTGYHLHWSIWHSGRAQNPIELMKSSIGL